MKNGALAFYQELLAAVATLGGWLVPGWWVVACRAGADGFSGLG